MGVYIIYGARKGKPKRKDVIQPKAARNTSIEALRLIAVAETLVLLTSNQRINVKYRIHLAHGRFLRFIQTLPTWRSDPLQ